VSTEFDTLNELYQEHEPYNQQPITSPKGGLDFMQYQRMIEEVRYQPNWRQEADKVADYYDGNQLDPETLAELEEKGMAPLLTNFIKPTIDVVLGIEAKTRSDWRVTADFDEYADVAEGISQKLKEAQRETHVDRACSDAYAGQIKAGLGWVEVSRNADPFEYKYRADFVHRREMFWDWTARKPDLSDARYIIRKRWYDIDHVALYWPEKASLLSAALGRWGGNWITAATENAYLANAFDQQRGSTISDFEWINPRRQRIALFEIWYRTFQKGKILKLPDRVVEFDPRNKLHRYAIEQGLVKPETAIYARMNLSVWAGPHRLQDSPTSKKRCPYVPFWGYREDLTGVPYGLIRSMISPQDEVNARRRKLMNILSSKRVIADSDSLDLAVNDFQDVLEEVSRPDSVIVLNPNRRNGDGLRVETDMGLAQQQFEVMRDAQESIQKAGGVYQAMLGDKSNASSGLAINSLVEQGMTTLAEINDNYRYSRHMVGEMMVDMIRDDLVGKPIQIVVGEGSVKRTVILNNPVRNQDGSITIQNDVASSNVKVALEDVPATPAYRMQQLQMLTDIVRAMPPQAQATLAPTFIEMSDLPERQQLADQVKQSLGLQQTDPGQDPQIAALQQKLQQAEQAIEQLKSAPQTVQAQARAQEAQINARKAKAEIAMDQQLTAAQIAKIEAETQKIRLENELESM